MAVKTMLPLQQLAVGGIFMQSFQSNRKYADFTVNGILNQTGGKKFIAPSAGRLRKHQTTCRSISHSQKLIALTANCRDSHAACAMLRAVLPKAALS